MSTKIEPGAYHAPPVLRYLIGDEVGAELRRREMQERRRGENATLRALLELIDANALWSYPPGTSASTPPKPVRVATVVLTRHSIPSSSAKPLAMSPRTWRRIRSEPDCMTRVRWAFPDAENWE